MRRATGKSRRSYRTQGAADTAPPTFTWAVSTDGLTVVGTASESLTANSPTASQFSFTGTACTVASASASGTTVTLTLDFMIESGPTVTISYTAAGAVKILDAAGNAADAISGGAVTNSSTQTLANQVSSVSMHYWFRGDLGITESGGAGTGVSTWADQSGNGNDVTQAVSLNRPQVSATGGPNNTQCLVGDGLLSSLANASLDLGTPTATPFFRLVLCKAATWTANDMITAHASSGLFMRQITSTPKVGQNNGANANLANMTLGTWFAVTQLFNNSTTDYNKLGSAAATTGENAGNTNPGAGFAFFSNASGTNNFDGSIAEAAAWAGAPNSTELSNINKILRGRYGSSGAIQ